MSNSETRIFRQLLIATVVFATACIVTQFANYERAFLRTPGLQLQDYRVLLPMCAPLILALLYLSSRINNWMEFFMTSFAIGLTGSAFIFVMRFLARPGFRRGDGMAMDHLFPFLALSTLLAAVILGVLWGGRVAVKILWNLPRAGKKFATKIRKATQIRKEQRELAMHQ